VSRTGRSSVVHRLLARPPVVGLAGRAPLDDGTEYDRFRKFVAGQRLCSVVNQIACSGACAVGERDDGDHLLAPPLAGTPTAVRTPDACTAAADELSALGIDRAHVDPEPLQVRTIQRRRIAGLAYERLTFEHDPVLPKTLTAEGLGGPATAVVHLCRRPGGPKPWLIWVHGAGQGGTEDLLVSRIGRIHHQLGFNVALPVQPGHGCRRRQWPAYPDMDPLGNVAGMMRAVSEVRAVVKWAQPEATAVVVSGISMGTPVAALVSHLERQIDAVGLYTPILGLNAMIARHLGRWGSSRDGYRELLGSSVVALVRRRPRRTRVLPAGAAGHRTVPA
jgi:hypothetical protein